MLEERAPASLVFLRPLANAENLSIAALVHADRNQQRDVAHLAGPTALEHDPVEISGSTFRIPRGLLGAECGFGFVMSRDFPASAEVSDAVRSAIADCFVGLE